MKYKFLLFEITIPNSLNYIDVITPSNLWLEITSHFSIKTTHNIFHAISCDFALLDK